MVEDERRSSTAIRRFLSYLPSNVFELPPRAGLRRPARAQRGGAALDRPPRPPQGLRHASHRSRPSLDRGSFFEMAPVYGRGQITGLARLDGQPVGVLANDPRFYAGAMTRARRAQGAPLRRPLRERSTCPCVSLVDEPGFMIGSAAEKAPARSATAPRRSSPWCSPACRGPRSSCARPTASRRRRTSAPAAHVLAWPSAEGGALPHRRRRRGGLPPRDRRRPRPGGATPRARGAASPPAARPSRAPRPSASTT